MRRARTTSTQAQWKIIVILIFLSALFVLAVHWVWDISDKKKLADQGLREVAKRHNYLQERSRVLEERNDFLHTQTGQQDYLVNRHAMVHQGERVLILVEGTVSLPPEQTTQEKTPWWKFW